MNPAYAIPAVAVVVLATVLIGGFGLRLSRTTSDFYVASRSVGPGLNAAAISGEYLSAASFLGVAGLLLVHGPDMLWYPVGYTAGYLVLLVFVAAPLRRSGAYTLPDFAESRLESRQVRLLVSMFVVGAGWLYLVPQLQGAGLTLSLLTGAPRWLGGAVVAVVVILAVAAGGMRSITFVHVHERGTEDEVVRLFDAVRVRHQDHHMAHHLMVARLAERHPELGRDPLHEVYDFAAWSAEHASPDSPLAVLPVVAHAERYRVLAGAGSEPPDPAASGHWRSRRARQVLRTAFDWWLEWEERLDRGRIRTDLNYLAHAKFCEGRPAEAAALFHRIGPHATRAPWAYLDRDPYDAFHAARSAALGAA
ncbi:hypothetical protein CLM82_04455 [Streptomyces albidoflavus]|uniref:sodium:solute symporter family transporter n=1 Tax=Streptomyces albidoflavus TaxID=1886 RepID=UPI000BAE42EF|nr:hypothetical protein [Streptomyces albidoflavus]PAX92262.1 hypothetical protein CLM82_04455 [Streptomyces albidoflavus]